MLHNTYFVLFLVKVHSCKANIHYKVYNQKHKELTPLYICLTPNFPFA